MIARDKIESRARYFYCPVPQAESVESMTESLMTMEPEAPVEPTWGDLRIGPDPDAHVDVVSSSQQYARRFAGPVGAWFLQVQMEKTRELLSGYSSLRILDVGGGHAQITPALLDDGHQVMVYGSSPACAALLRPWRESGRCEYVSGDLCHLPFSDRSFDIVLSFRILAHMGKWRTFLAELCRVADQSVLVEYPSRRSVNRWADRFFEVKSRVEGDTRSFQSLQPSIVANAFAEQEFEVAEERNQFLLPMFLHRFHGSRVLAGALEAPGRLLGLTRAFGSPVIARADRVERRS